MPECGESDSKGLPESFAISRSRSSFSVGISAISTFDSNWLHQLLSLGACGWLGVVDIDVVDERF